MDLHLVMQIDQERRCREQGWQERGFTLIELLTVLATIALLIGILLPALAGTRPDAQLFRCLNNTKQLTTAWRMYSNDNFDLVVPNPGWVGGMLDWSTSPQNTNTTQLLDPTQSAIASYVKAAELFKCPADTYQYTGSLGARVRSYSIDGALTSTSGGPTLKQQIPGRTYFVAKRVSELSIPGPAMVFVVLDEHPDSINDGTFMLDPGYAPGNEKWRDLPGSHHAGAASISLADGHAEVRKWEDSRTMLPVLYQQWFLQPSYNQLLGRSLDYEWLDDRMPYH